MSQDEITLDAGTIGRRVAERHEAQALAQAEADAAPVDPPPGAPTQNGASGPKPGEPAPPKKCDPNLVAAILRGGSGLVGREGHDYLAPLEPGEAATLAGPLAEIIDKDYPWLTPWLEESPYGALILASLMVGLERHKRAEERKAAEKEAEEKRKASEPRTPKADAA